MKHRRGFTLIEALAATALAAIMMTAVMSVVSALARHDDTDKTHQYEADWQRQLLYVIRQDLLHADAFTVSENRLTLTGHAALDHRTFKPNHRPAVVTYAVTEYAGQSWLMRTQTDPESNALHNAWAQPVCAGILDIQLTSESQAPGDELTPDPAMPLSDTVTLTLAYENGQTSSIPIMIR